MSLPIPLTVRLITAKADQHITPDLRSLSFRSVVPGGFASAQMSLSRPLTMRPDEISYYGRVVVYDARNGRTVWEGRLEDPGRGVGPDGQIWDLAATGPSAHASDSNAPVIWQDRRLDGAWVVYEAKSRVNAKTEFAQDGAGNPVIRLGAPPGTGVIAANWRASMIYRALRDTGQRLARVRVGWDAGFTSSGWQIELFSHDPADAETVVDTALVNVAGGELVGVYSTDIPAGDDAVEFLFNRPTAGDATEVTWVIGLIYSVRAALHAKNGALITTGYTADTVLASEVVADLLGTRLPQFDGASAAVTPSTYQFDQLAYPDGVTPAEVFNDLMALEPTFYWAAWEAVRPGGGGPTFDVRSFGSGTGNLAFTHRPTTPPKAVLVMIAQDVGITDEVTSVTYGGLPLAEVPLSPLIHSTGAEDGVLYGYFLGSAIPAGPQPVAVTVNGTGSSKLAVCMSMYSDATTVEIEDTSALDSAGAANPAVTLTTEVVSLIAAVLHSGHDDVASHTPAAGYTETPGFTDFGGQTASWIIGTAPAAPGSPTAGWTATSEEAGILAVAMRNGPADRYRFEWREWPTTVAYEASVEDGYKSTGSAEGLYNKVQIRWRNQLGLPRTTTAAQTVAELTAAGLIREGYLDLSDEIGSATNANRAAQQFLTEHAAPPNQGTLTISRPIYDHSLGRMIAPWEIRPGKLIRVRGILATSDTLNATQRDGVTVFKVIAVDFDASSASARCELDSQPLTLAHLLAQIKHIPITRWRERWR